jgi:UDP-glucose 4-epimerase
MAERVILVGGNSQAARALRQRFPKAISVVRKPCGLAREVVVDSYDAPPPVDLADAIVINCAGTPRGNRDELERANCKVPLAWADRRVSRFVQISSFSVYGHAQSIGAGTPEAPSSDYGRSKCAAERRLEAQGLGDRLTVLRVPILIGGDHDKLAQLVHLSRRLGFAPTAPWPTPRSMLSYDGLAATVAGLITDKRGGTYTAADPVPFTFDMLRDQLGTRLATVPRACLSVIRRVAPGIHASMFEASLLDGSVNVAADYRPFDSVSDVVSHLTTASA